MAALYSPAAACSWMEGLCSSFSVDPKGVERQLLSLRTQPQAMDIIEAILQDSQLPMAQFHALCALQAVALSRWDDMTPEKRRRARDSTLEWVLSRHSQLSRTVQTQALQVVAVLWKRSWTAEPPESRQAFLAQLGAMAASTGDPAALLLSAKALSALVSEFGGQPTSVGLPLEFHRAAHAAFAKHGLLESMALAFDIMSVLMAAATAPGALRDPVHAELLMVSTKLTGEVSVEQHQQQYPAVTTAA
jgi:hypothetical protein